MQTVAWGLQDVVFEGLVPASIVPPSPDLFMTSSKQSRTTSSRMLTSVSVKEPGSSGNATAATATKHAKGPSDPDVHAEYRSY